MMMLEQIKEVAQHLNEALNPNPEANVSFVLALHEHGTERSLVISNRNNAHEVLAMLMEAIAGYQQSKARDDSGHEPGHA
jgi:hypothetical protein